MKVINEEWLSTRPPEDVISPLVLIVVEQDGVKLYWAPDGNLYRQYPKGGWTRLSVVEVDEPQTNIVRTLQEGDTFTP